MLPPSMLNRGLYAIVDVDITQQAGFDILDFAKAVLDAAPAAIQLRAKRLAGREHLNLLERIVRQAEPLAVPVFANDRPDLAVLAGCAGVHVGQSDVAVPDVRRLDARLKIGLSTANRAQLSQAIALRPDYVALGPVFPTDSKLDADPAVGLELLREAGRLCAQANLPLVAIGGIHHDRARDIAQSGAVGAAISALIPPERTLGTVPMLARALHLALGGE